MSDKVDNRVVSLEFENKQFEREIRRTADSLRMFEDNLNNIGVKSGMDGLDALANRFSTLKTIGMLTFSDLTSSAIKFGTSLIKNAVQTASAKGRGRAMNIEQARFMLGGMGVDVEAAMDSASKAVTGTAFALDEAAGAAARFAATGMDAGDDMLKSLRAISGVAGLTGSSFAEMADIFTDTAAEGELSGMTLSRLEQRSFGATSILAKHFKVTSEELKDMVKNGEVSYNEFATIIENLYGDHAQKANETYAGSLANIGSALGRIGAGFHESRMGMMREIFNALIPLINGVKDAMGPLYWTFGAIANQSAQAVKFITAAFIGLTGEGKASSEFVERLRVSFENLSHILKYFHDLFRAILAGLGFQLGNVFKGDFLEQLQKVTGAIRTFFESLKPLKDEEGNYRDLPLTRLFGVLFSIIRLGIHIIAGFLSVIKAVFEGFSRGGGSISKIIGKLADVVIWFTWISIESGRVAKVFEIIGNVAGWLAEMFSRLIAFVAPKVWRVFHALLVNLGTPLTFLGEMFYRIGGVIANLFSKGSPAVAALADAFNRVKEAVASAFPSLDATGSRMDSIREKIGQLGDWIISKLPNVEQLSQIFSGVGDFFVDLVGKIGSIIPTLDEVKAAFAILGNFFVGLWDALSPITNFITGIFTSILKLFGIIRDTIFSTTVPLDEVSGTCDTAGNNREKLKAFLEGLVTGFKKAGEGIVGFFRWLGEGITTFFGWLDVSGVSKFIDDHWGKVLTGGVLAIIYKITSAFSSLAKPGGLGNALGISDAFNSIADSFRQFVGATEDTKTDKFASIAKSILMIAGSLAILALTAFLLSKADLGRVSKALVVLTGALVGVSASLWTLNKYSGDAVNFTAIGAGVMMVALSMLILASALAILTRLDPKKVEKAIAQITALLAGLTAAMTVMGHFGGDMSGMASAGMGILLIAIALTVLTIPIMILGRMKWEEVQQGLTGLAWALLMLTVVMGGLSSMAGSGDMLKVGAGLLLISIALALLVIPIMILGSIPWETLVQGLLGIFGALMAIVVPLILLEKVGGDMAKIGVGFLLLGTGLIMMAIALKVVADIPFDNLRTGVIALSALLLVMVIVANTLEAAVKGVAGMLIMAGAILVIALALDMLSQVDTTAMLYSTIALLAIMIMLSMVAISIQSVGAAGPAGLLVMAGALLVLAGVFQIMGAMSFGDLAKSLGFIMLTMLAFIAIGALLVVLGPAAIAGVTMMIAFGAAVALLGFGMMMLATAFERFADSSEQSSAALVRIFTVIILFIPRLLTAIAIGLVGMLVEFLNAIPALVEALTLVITTILEAVRTLAPQFMETAVVLITAFLDGFNRIQGTLINTVVNLFLNLLRAVRDNIEEFTTIGADIIINFLNGLATQMPGLVAAGANLIVEFLNGLADNIGDITAAGTNLLVELIYGIGIGMARIARAVVDVVTELVAQFAANWNLLVDAGVDALREFLQGMIDGIEDTVTMITDFLVALVAAIANGILRGIDGMATVVVNFLNGLADIIENRGQEIITAAGNVARAIINLIANNVPGPSEFFEFARNFIRGLINAVLDHLGPLRAVGERIMRPVLDGMEDETGIESPSKVTYQMGLYLIEGLTNALNQDTTAAQAGRNLASDTINAFATTIQEISSIIDTMDEFDPVIAPVLDLSSVESEATRLQDILGGQPFDAELSNVNAAAIAALANQVPSEDDGSGGPNVTEVKFEQTINSPDPLTTAAIYNATKSQIQMAKEELELI